MRRPTCKNPIRETGAPAFAALQLRLGEPSRLVARRRFPFSKPCRHGFAISRRQAPESCLNFPPPIAEGVGNAGCPVHPQPRTRILVVSMRTSIHSEVTGIIRHSPRNGLTAYNELSPVIGFLATVISGLRFCPSPVGPEKTSANLTPAPRRQDHTLLPYAARPARGFAGPGTGPTNSGGGVKRRSSCVPEIAHG
jgi:hypothetical protein